MKKLEGFSRKVLVLFLATACSTFVLPITSTIAADWQIAIVDPGSGVPYVQHISIALDRNNNPGIAYAKWEDPKVIKFAKFDGSVWKIEDVKTFNGTGAGADLAFDSGSFPRMVSDDYPTSHSYSEWDGSSWQTQTFSALPSNADIQTDASDVTHIVWYASANLEYRSWDGSIWQVQTVDTVGDVGYNPYLVLDDQGHRYVSYAVWGHALKFAYYDGTNWSTEFVDSSTASANAAHPIALDNQNSPVILYTDVDGTVMLAKKVDSQWQFETIPLSRLMGQVGFMIDDANNIHISCYQEESETYYVKYFLYDGTQWTSDVIEQFTGSITDVRYTDLALSPDGTVHVAYVDLNNNDLKYAISTPSGPISDIKANGRDGTVVVTPNRKLNITVSLDPGSMPEVSCDWWIGGLTTSGTYWLNSSMQWVKSGTPISVRQGVLLDLAEKSVLNTKLPVGVYTFFFMLDDKPDGAFDITWGDFVNVVCWSGANQVDSLTDLESIFQEQVGDPIDE